MQQVIETEFAEQTVLSVVHRLRYIDRYDKVAVMHNGNIAEFDSPEVLLSKPSILASMKRAGESASSRNSNGGEE
jgi:ABC-type multidrug transport system fused ATPase/permease subunit